MCAIRRLARGTVSRGGDRALDAAHRGCSRRGPRPGARPRRLGRPSTSPRQLDWPRFLGGLLGAGIGGRVVMVAPSATFWACGSAVPADTGARGDGAERVVVVGGPGLGEMRHERGARRRARCGRSGARARGWVATGEQLRSGAGVGVLIAGRCAEDGIDEDESPLFFWVVNGGRTFVRLTSSSAAAWEPSTSCSRRARWGAPTCGSATRRWGSRPACSPPA